MLSKFSCPTVFVVSVPEFIGDWTIDNKPSHWLWKFVYALSLRDQICVRILIDGASLRTHSNWRSKFVYTFSLADQVCVLILIGGAKLCTHSHWQSKFMYAFSLAEQVYVLILIDGANLCTHSHWLIKFVYPFSLAEKSCLHILIGGANLCTHSLWLSKFMYTWGAKKHSKQLLTDTILLGNRYKVMSICFHVVCKSKLSCYLQVAESLTTPVILL